MKYRKYLHILFFEYEWLICAREYSDPPTKSFEARNEAAEYHVIKMNRHYWAADPFIFTWQNDDYLFFEYFHKKKNKAVIGCKKIGNQASDERVIYESDYHMSYPCVFENNGHIYMIPETNQAKQIVLLECVHFPDKWVEKSVLREHISAMDCTAFSYDGKLLLFVFERIKDGKNLYLASLDTENGTLSDFRLVKQYDAKHGRPGGNVICENGRYYRVVQPCVRRYGEKLELFEFSVKDGKYREKKAGELTPKDVSIDRNINIDGIHTLNQGNQFEVIDIHTYGRFSLLKPFRLLFIRLGLFGYDDYDRKKERLYHTVSDKR